MLANRGIRCEDGLMKKKKIVAALGAVAIALSLSACNTGAQPAGEPISGDVIAPMMTSYINLDGGTIAVKVGQVIVINTGDHPVDSLDGTSADPSIAEFVPGRIEASAEFNPGYSTKSVGETTATLTRDWGDPIEFTIKVTE